MALESSILEHRPKKGKGKRPRSDNLDVLKAKGARSSREAGKPSVAAFARQASSKVTPRTVPGRETAGSPNVEFQ